MLAQVIDRVPAQQPASADGADFCIRLLADTEFRCSEVATRLLYVHKAAAPHVRASTHRRSTYRLAALRPEGLRLVKPFAFPHGFRELHGHEADIQEVGDAYEALGSAPQLQLRKPEHVPGHVWYSLCSASQRWLCDAERLIEDTRAQLRKLCSGELLQISGQACRTT